MKIILIWIKNKQYKRSKLSGRDWIHLVYVKLRIAGN
jgi:hypothetical protein